MWGSQERRVYMEMWNKVEAAPHFLHPAASGYVPGYIEYLKVGPRLQCPALRAAPRERALPRVVPGTEPCAAQHVRPSR